MKKILNNKKIKSIIIETSKDNRDYVDSFLKQRNFTKNLKMYLENDDNLIYDRK
jgi:hypothetical protein